MSITQSNRINGKLQYKNKLYKVLNSPLSDAIVQKLETYDGNEEWIDSKAPWRTMPLLWKLEEGKLYLVKLYVDGLLEELMGSEKIFASWVDELRLFIDDRTVCKIHDPKERYVEEQTVLHLHFDKGVFLSEEEQTELFTSGEKKDGMDGYPAYTAIHADSHDLLIYMEDDMRLEQDQLLPLFADLVEQMIDEDDEISLGMGEVKEVLERGDLCIFAAAKGKDIDTITGSLISSVTNENILSPKGCLLHMMSTKKYPRASIAKIIEGIDEGLKFNFEPLEPEMKEPFYVGTRFVHGLEDDEVSIRILVSV